VLCFVCAEGWSVDPASSACVPPGGAAISLQAALAAGEEEGATRLELPVSSERRVREDRYLCLGPQAPPPKGARFTRAAVHASAPIRVQRIVWVDSGIK
jgi:hypothetical protein